MLVTRVRLSDRLSRCGKPISCCIPASLTGELLRHKVRKPFRDVGSSPRSVIRVPENVQLIETRHARKALQAGVREI